LKGLVLKNGRITILEVDNVVGISFGSFQSSLNYNQNRCHITTKFITHLPIEGRKGITSASARIFRRGLKRCGCF
jgi:hypothetical protein